MIVRPARSTDAEAIVAFNRALAAETEGKALVAAQIEAGVRSVLEDPRKGFYLVAELAGRVVGQLMVTAEWSDWRNGYFWWIQSVYIEAGARRNGVYRALHHHLIEVARARTDVCGVRLYVERENTRAKATYRALGMHETRYDLYEMEFAR